MSLLAKKVIEVLKDENILENIIEDEATEDEINIINNYIKEDNKESISLNSLVKDLGLDK